MSGSLRILPRTESRNTWDFMNFSPSLEESELQASSTTSVSSSSLWRVVERASWPLEMLSSRSRSLMTSLDSWVVL